MAAGAAAFTAYCVVAVPALRRFGAWYGSGIALGAWILMATALFVLVAR
jgi:hypothetical protein